MTLKIIGSGFGRTGTMSTKLALEQLGFGPCHHMLEVMQSPAQLAYWSACADGAKMDWVKVFEGFTTQVDFPGAAVWEQLVVAFPNAKVLHNERPEEEWWASYSKTICKAFAHRNSLPVPPPIATHLEKMDKLLIQDLFGGLDRESSIAAYRRNNEKVRAIVPADKLLVFTPSDGWTPLCEFLGVKAPATDFPRSNARDEFWGHFGGEPA